MPIAPEIRQKMCLFHSRLKCAVDFVHTAELGTRKVEGRFINTGMSARAGKIDNRLCGDGGKFWTISDRGEEYMKRV